MNEAGGNPNIEDYGGMKPRYRLYFNRQSRECWFVFSIENNPNGRGIIERYVKYIPA